MLSESSHEAVGAFHLTKNKLWMNIIFQNVQKNLQGVSIFSEICDWGDFCSFWFSTQNLRIYW